MLRRCERKTPIYTWENGSDFTNDNERHQTRWNEKWSERCSNSNYRIFRQRRVRQVEHNLFRTLFLDARFPSLSLSLSLLFGYANKQNLSIVTPWTWTKFYNFWLLFPFTIQIPKLSTTIFFATRCPLPHSTLAWATVGLKTISCCCRANKYALEFSTHFPLRVTQCSRMKWLSHSSSYVNSSILHISWMAMRLTCMDRHISCEYSITGFAFRRCNLVHQLTLFVYNAPNMAVIYYTLVHITLPFPFFRGPALLVNYT